MKNSINSSLLFKKSIFGILIFASILLYSINLYSASTENTTSLEGRENCVSCGQCVDKAPNSFELDEIDGKVNIKIVHPDSHEVFHVREAKKACPLQIISTNF